MSDVAIRVEGLGKLYKIGKLRRRHDTLRDRIADARVFSLFRGRNGGTQRAKGTVQSSSLAEDSSSLASGRLPSALSPSPIDSIWALKDVSFDVRRGEVIGIIGRNGAGKSTLLKILSRITEPTEGYAEINGRVASLLEVGTGFHQELTGRENIYLNGAILGMARNEIVRKFDEIVSFAEVEKFIDTPVKHYSSGMYLRLAFAVAAHLEPEILLVDEVLAVGDARFQRKCLDKMQDVGKQGHTILFVSHNMAAITRLCPRTILLDQGHVLSDGPSHQVASEHLSGGLGTTAPRTWPGISPAPGDEIVRLLAVRVRAENGEVHDVMDIRKPIAIEMEFVVLQGGHELTPNYHFFNEHGV